MGAAPMGSPGMSCVGFLHGVYGQKPNRINAQFVELRRAQSFVLGGCGGLIHGIRSPEKE